MGKRIKFTYDKSKFLHGVAVLTGGTVMGQVLVIIASPILTRLYSPEDFGLLAVFSATISMISIVASLHYELAIPLPADDGEALDLLSLSLTIVILLSILLSILCAFFGSQFVSLLNASKLKPFIWFFPVSLLGVGTYQFLSYWAIRKKAFALTAKTKLAQSFGQISAQVGIGLIQPGALGLLIGQLVGQIAGVSSLARFAGKSWGDNSKIVSLAGMKMVAGKYRRFPLFASWSSLINLMSTQMPVLMLSYYFGGVITGLYALGYRILQLPMRFVGQSISQVYFSSAAEANLAGTLSHTTEKVFRNLLVICLPFFVLLGIIAPELFSVVFGASWQKAGVYVQILMPWFFFAFIVTPLSMLVSVLEKQATELILQIIFLFFLSVSFVIGGMQSNADLSIFLFSLTGSLYSLGKIFWLLSICDVSLNDSLKFMLWKIVSMAPLAAFLVLVKVYAGSPIVVSLVGSAALLLVAARMACRYRTFDPGQSP